MSDLQWISITTNIFDHEKIRYLEKMPDGYAMIVIWFKLLMMAGRCNDCGLIYLTREMPYNEEMIATVMDMNINTVRLALNEFVTLRMIEIKDSYIAIANWEKYQQQGIENIREKARIRQENYRNKQKLLLSNVTNNVTVTRSSYSSSSSYSLFLYWNEKENLITHSKIESHLPEIERALKIYNPEEIKNAIDRYNRVTALPDSLYAYKWTLKDFLKRGLHKFVDEQPDTNFLKDNQKAGMIDRVYNKLQAGNK